VTPRELEEYKALRRTIAQRGTARVWIQLVGLIGWAGVTIATAAAAQLPVATLLPLLVLATTFEIAFALHTGVERIGRYIQVVFENDQTDRGWEHFAMDYGRSFPGGGSDPLLSTYFWSAVVFNFLPVITAEPVPLEWGTVGAIHLIVIIRIFRARSDARRQRAIDLQRFQELKQKL
jgi:hypothetical protein